MIDAPGPHTRLFKVLALAPGLGMPPQERHRLPEGLVPSGSHVAASFFQQPLHFFGYVQIELRPDKDLHAAFLEATFLRARWNAASNLSRDKGSSGPLASA